MSVGKNGLGQLARHSPQILHGAGKTAYPGLGNDAIQSRIHQDMSAAEGIVRQ